MWSTENGFSTFTYSKVVVTGSAWHPCFGRRDYCNIADFVSSYLCYGGLSTQKEVTSGPLAMASSWQSCCLGWFAAQKFAEPRCQVWWPHVSPTRYALIIAISYFLRFQMNALSCFQIWAVSKCCRQLEIDSFAVSVKRLECIGDPSSVSHIYGFLLWLHCQPVLGQVPCLVVSTAAAAKELFRTHDVIFSYRPKRLDHEIISGKSYKSLTSAPYGPYWRQIRRICNTELFSPAIHASHVSVRSEEIHSMMKVLLAESRTEKAIDLKSWLTGVTANNMTRMLINKRWTSDLRNFESSQRVIVVPHRRFWNFRTNMVVILRKLKLNIWKGEQDGEAISTLYWLECSRDRFFGTGVSDQQEKKDFEEIFDHIFAAAGTFFISDFIPKLRFVEMLQGKIAKLTAFRKFLHSVIGKIFEVEKHRQRALERGNDPIYVPDFVDVLLNTPLDNGERLTDREIISILSVSFSPFRNLSDMFTAWITAQNQTCDTHCLLIVYDRYN